MSALGSAIANSIKTHTPDWELLELANFSARHKTLNAYVYKSTTSGLFTVVEKFRKELEAADSDPISAAFATFDQDQTVTLEQKLIDALGGTGETPPTPTPGEGTTSI